MFLFDICPLVAAKVRFATRKDEKSSSFKEILLDFAQNTCLSQRSRWHFETNGDGRIEIHKKILIFWNVIQNIISIFWITFFFYYLCKKLREQAAPRQRTGSLHSVCAVLAAENDKAYEISKARAIRHDYEMT
jgi:hypothetical protein